MLARSTIAALVVATACSASKGNDVPGRDDDKPAGKVLAATGKVAAKRANGSPRRLQKDDDVFANDTIFTDKHSSARILLFHNRTELRLAAMRVRALYGSGAWRAAKGSTIKDVAPNDRIVVTEQRPKGDPVLASVQTIVNACIAKLGADKVGSGSFVIRARPRQRPQIHTHLRDLALCVNGERLAKVLAGKDVKLDLFVGKR